MAYVTMMIMMILLSFAIIFILVVTVILVWIAMQNGIINNVVFMLIFVPSLSHSLPSKSTVRNYCCIRKGGKTRIDHKRWISKDEYDDEQKQKKKKMMKTKMMKSKMIIVTATMKTCTTIKY